MKIILKRNKKKYIRICPKCHSLDIEVDWRHNGTAVGFPSSHRCRGCGFTSKIFPEINLSGKARKKQEKNKK